jgi:hypothetical protein
VGHAFGARRLRSPSAQGWRLYGSCLVLFLRPRRQGMQRTRCYVRLIQSAP